MTACRCLLLLALPAALASAEILAAPRGQPHIVLAVIDDLGYAGLGFSSPRGEPRTPVIDGLAQQGVVLKRHYAFKFCSPSRAALLSGRLPLHVNQNNCESCGIPLAMRTIGEVLQGAGYATHHAGKWHVGMATRGHLPVHRGFDSSLAMLGGAADHYTGARVGGPEHNLFWARDIWKDDGPAAQMSTFNQKWFQRRYSTYRFMAHALEVIQSHNTSRPFFLFMSFQSVHAPFQAPEKYLEPYDEDMWYAKRYGLAQVALVDESVGKLIDALQKRKMWEDTLFIVSSDNGGPVEHESNYPLRGAKGSDLEGGVRAIALAAGPVIPSAQRGKELSQMVHIADWYATFAQLAGVDPRDLRAEEQELPPVDSVSLWPLLSGASLDSPRKEIALSGGRGRERWPSQCAGLVQERWKLVRGLVLFTCSPGPTTPNSSDLSGMEDQVACSHDCGEEGCLFDLEEDPTEGTDLADHNPAKHAELLARAREIDESQIDSDVWEPGELAAVGAAKDLYGGIWGPYVGEDGKRLLPNWQPAHADDANRTLSLRSPVHRLVGADEQRGLGGARPEPQDISQPAVVEAFARALRSSGSRGGWPLKRSGSGIARHG